MQFYFPKSCFVYKINMLQINLIAHDLYRKVSDYKIVFAVVKPHHLACL